MVNSTVLYTGWEEVVVSNEKGLREVHYYLKRSGGAAAGADLVVVGKEKGLRNMSFYYAVKDNKSLLSTLKCSSLLKLRSRKEVINWLNTIVPDVNARPSHKQCDIRSKDGQKLNAHIIKDVQNLKQGQNVEFLWLGSPLNCRKRRARYESFFRNGVKISVNDFVYVLAEEGKRLVAYLDDMYEDSRGNKMVVVRWFHKIDEVGFVLPHNYNEREIYFSLCLQDLSIECIDGLATVLSPDHYQKYSHLATNMQWDPLVCSKLFDNDEIKPFDITQIEGYWKQKILTNISPRLETSDDGRRVEETLSDVVQARPNKRIRVSKDSEINLDFAAKRELTNASQHGGGRRKIRLKLRRPAASLSGQDSVLPKCKNLTIGSQVEVLSQDSGLRGCWFRALIIKKHKDKVKLKYQDIKDADDEKKHLEEWVSASRLALPDELGIRSSGRTILRPAPVSHSGRLSSLLGISIGSIVDSWLHDGWWEGIVVNKESEDKLRVYFPGEKKEQILSSRDLRLSQEWHENSWKYLNKRPDVVSKTKQSACENSDTISDNPQECQKSSGEKKEQILSSRDLRHSREWHENSWKYLNERSDVVSKTKQSACENSDTISDNPLPVKAVTNDKKPMEINVVSDLTKYLDCELRWKSSGKRRRSRSPVHYGGNSFDFGIQAFDNCKYASDTLTSAVVSSIPNMVMSR